ncbi:lipoprotein, putative [Lunatimonas lonarensis]|uniref:Lipoprotein, putative n=1 Tax=Lunatimonas lonarensis TaxID=1232681 RepID=R7ZVP4_9BACT|nr:DUF4136 domain-containing protein [Lunatimonas lonarensis]EON78152.1 lipoprotein, putative [Lunatimonas lonarensis]
MNHKAFIFGWILVGLLGCSPSKLQVTEVAEDFVLEKYSTFDFYKTDASGDLGDNYQAGIDFLKGEIAKQMAYRGLLRDEESPQVWVNIGVWVEEQTQTRETGLVTDPGTFNYIGQRRYSWKSETVELGTYKKGTVTLHLVDATENNALWIGTVEEILVSNEDRLRNRIMRGVEKVFIEIP